MFNKDYIKEKLNTLRVILMARVLILIAIGGGLLKAIFYNNINTYIVILGLSLFVIMLIMLIKNIHEIEKFTNYLKE